MFPSFGNEISKINMRIFWKGFRSHSELNRKHPKAENKMRNFICCMIPSTTSKQKKKLDYDYSNRCLILKLTPIQTDQTGLKI